MKDWVDEFLSFSHKRKKKIKLGKERPFKRKKKYVRIPTTTLTDKEIIQYIVFHKIDTLAKLRELRKTDSKIPTTRVVWKRFGCWQNLKDLAFGYVDEKISTRCEDREFLRVFCDYKILRYVDFLKYKKKYPLMFPSYAEILKRFGRWSNLRRVVEGLMLESIMERYLKLQQRLDRIPTERDCDNYGVEVYRLIEVFGKTRLHELASRIRKSLNEDS